VTAFYFGASERPLFGFYHAAAGPGRGAVVVCPPGAGEYQFAHRALRVLAQRLAGAGHHVLRFDYSGTGDSWGATTEADPDLWSLDAAEAIEELKQLSGRTRVDLVGLRFGALVAARVAAGRGDVGRLVLWDPVLDGTAWVEELAAGRPLPHGDGGPIELSAHLLSPGFAAKIRKLGPRDVPPEPAARSLLLLTQGGDSEQEENPLAHVRSLEVERITASAPWAVDQSIWTGQVPAEAVRRITEWLA
jgi:pimeloyl-ACP methyl ester carboxylesterase